VVYYRRKKVERYTLRTQGHQKGVDARAKKNLRGRKPTPPKKKKDRKRNGHPGQRGRDDPQRKNTGTRGKKGVTRSPGD